MTPPVVRAATEADAAACAAIYAPYVTDTAITFENDVPDAAEIGQRIVVAQRDHVWLVAERDGQVIGYAYGGGFRTRVAYRWSCEVSVYLEPGLRRTGAGRALYEELFARLAERGFVTAIGALTLPNDESVGLHEALGFRLVGVFEDVGFKHGAWHDVAFYQRDLAPRRV